MPCSQTTMFPVGMSSERGTAPLSSCDSNPAPTLHQQTLRILTTLSPRTSSANIAHSHNTQSQNFISKHCAFSQHSVPELHQKTSRILTTLSPRTSSANTAHSPNTQSQNFISKHCAFSQHSVPELHQQTLRILTTLSPRSSEGIPLARREGTRKDPN